MQRLRAGLQRLRRGHWAAAVALLLATPLLGWLDYRLGQFPANAGPPLCFLPVMAGCFLLTPLQELGLALAFTAEWTWAIGSQGDVFSGHHLMSLINPIPLLAAMVWFTHLRQGCSLQRAALTQQRNALTQKLERSLEASALAHELGQPLSQLMLQLRLMQFRLEQQPELAAATGRVLGDMQSSGEQIQELIAAMSRLLRNSDPATTAVDLGSIARTCLQQMAPSLAAAGIALSCSGLHNNHLVVGDAKQLEIAILNLLRNALCSLSAQPPGQRQLRMTLALEPQQLVLHVADSGPGLPCESAENLLLNSQTPGGMGLGLLVVSGVARRHGGELRLGTSAELGGAELCLSLPAAR